MDMIPSGPPGSQQQVSWPGGGGGEQQNPAEGGMKRVLPPVPQIADTLKTIEAALKRAEKPRRLRLICSCGDKTCTIGEFNVFDADTGEVIERGVPRYTCEKKYKGYRSNMPSVTGE